MSNSYSNISFDLSRNMALKKANKDNNNNLVQIHFGGPRPTLSIINCGSIPNTIKVYKSLKSNTYVVIKIENNRIYRLIGPKLIGILINNIDINWRLIISYKNMSNFDIRRLYLEYNIR